jgi:hypothetical protein
MSLRASSLLPPKTLVAGLVVCGFATLQLACGGGSGSSVTLQTPVPAGQPTFSHVVLVVEENHSYSEVIGNSSMPYVNSLASQYGLATQYFADAHFSLPNYLMLTTGLTETFDDNFSGTISDDNVVRELVKAGPMPNLFLRRVTLAPMQAFTFGVTTRLPIYRMCRMTKPNRPT